MKKILVRVILVLVVLLVAALIAVGLSLDGIVKRGVETVGPKLTGVEVKLESVSLSVLSGSGTIKGLSVGNPKGFKSPQAITMGSATLSLKPTSVFSDKIVIRKFEVIAPEITLELGLGGNNLGKILANVNSATGGSSTNAAAPAKEPSPGKKLEVDDFLISGAKVHASVTELSGSDQTVTIPDIHFSDLGKGPEGITSGELLKVVLPVIEREAVKAATTKFPELSKRVDELTRSVEKSAGGSISNLNRELEKSAGTSVTNLTRGLDGLLKKK